MIIKIPLKDGSEELLYSAETYNSRELDSFFKKHESKAAGIEILNDDGSCAHKWINPS